jgi:hypothetical protein
MTPSLATAPLSRRFISAAESERRRLETKRGRLVSQLERVDRDLSKLQPFTQHSASSQAVEGELRGKAIREVAVEILAEVHGSAPIHYRDWLALVEGRGWKVAGVRPDSVFNNQVRRHPAVRSSTQRGVFCLDSAFVRSQNRTSAGTGEVATS